MYKPLLISASVFVACASTAVFAQGRVERSFEPSPKDCADVKWSRVVLDVYPGIPSACQSIQRRDGKTYVMLEGTVDAVVDGGDQVRVDFEDGGEVTLTPPANTTIYVEGEETSVADLRRGMELNFYIPEDRLQAEFQPASTTTRYVVVPIALTPVRERSQQTAQAEDRGEFTAANELPATASVLPLFAVAGAGLLLVGAGFTVGRKLRR